EALACLERAADVPPPDFELAILDVQLASGGGAEALLPELRARRPGLAFIVISGDALPPALERMLAAQGGRFLRKPFAPTALLAVVGAPRGGGSEGGGPARGAGAGCQVSSSVAAGSEC